MRNYWITLTALALCFLIAACTGGGVHVGTGAGVYRHHHIGPWWGARSYYRDRVIVVPPEREVDPDFGVDPPSSPEPELMPEMPDMDMDMGMPDIDLGD